MVKCCVPKCTNASYRKAPDITFHRFPKDEHLKSKWIESINRKDWQPNETSVVCSRHFEISLLYDRDVRRILAPGAVPTVFPDAERSEEDIENATVMPAAQPTTAMPELDEPSPSTSTISRTGQEYAFDVPLQSITNRKRTVTGCDQIITAQSATAAKKVQLKLNSPNIPHTATDRSLYIDESQDKENLSCFQIQSIINESSSSSMPQTAAVSSLCASGSNLSEDSGKKTTKLRNTIIKKNKKIKSLQEKNRRMKKKVQQFSDVIAGLKKKLNEEQMSILSNIPVSNKDFMVRYLKKAQGSTVEKYYPPEIRSFALQLNFFSARAYNFVRDYFNTVLPHPGTLSRWYKKIDAEPGFTSESFQTLESCKYKFYVNLSIDEMAIRKEQVWDRVNNKFRGHVDTGTEVSDDSLPLATQALVLMVTAINACWKLPIAYLFIASMTGEQRANIVRMAIAMLYDIYIFVCGLTFDGAANNISMATVLGCNFDFNNFTPYFCFKELKIYAFYDPCHMIKLIRNCFGDFKIIVDKDGNIINFEYLELLQNLSQKKGLHLGVKIRKAHILFAKQKMKVRLAAQLFSRSVGDALLFCKDILLLEEFKECAATIKFVNLVNDCFDILNSRTTLAPGNKKAICSANIDRIKDFVAVTTDYLLHLKFTNGNTIVNSARKTGFVGFIICLHNVMNLFNDLLNRGGIRYLCSYRISQDHLEMFFGKMRSRGGFNDNPNVVQFRTAYKKNLIVTELQLREKGILEESSILSVLQKR